MGIWDTKIRNSFLKCVFFRVPPASASLVRGHSNSDFFGYFGGVLGRFCALWGRILALFGTIRCVSSSYEFSYPICPPSSKDIGIITKKPQIWLFWARFGDFARFGGRIWARFWHDPMRLIELRILVPHMPTYS